MGKPVAQQDPKHITRFREALAKEPAAILQFFDKYPEYMYDFTNPRGNPDYVDKVRTLDTAAIARVADIEAKEAITREAINDLYSQKEELLADSAWLRSDAASAYSAVMHATTAFCTLLVEIIPPPNGLFDYRAYYSGLQQMLLQGSLTEATLGVFFDVAAAQDRRVAGATVAGAATALLNFAGTLMAAEAAGRDREHLRQEVARQVIAIEAQIERYEQVVETSRDTWLRRMLQDFQRDQSEFLKPYDLFIDHLDRHPPR